MTQAATGAAATPDELQRRMLVATPDRHTVRMIRSCAVVDWPDIGVHHFDPLTTGELPAAAELASYDAIMLGADDYLPYEGLGPERLSRTLDDVFWSAGAPAGGTASATLTLHPPDAASTTDDATRAMALDEMPVAVPIPFPARHEHLREDANPDDTGVLYLPGRSALRVPGYRILEMPGAGAMVKAFVADRPRDGQRVAFKVLDVNDGGDPALLQRFMREYKLLRGAAATAQSDLYSLGVVFHEMLTGKKPFTAPKLTSLIEMHLNAPPDPHRPHGVHAADARPADGEVTGRTATRCCSRSCVHPLVNSALRWAKSALRWAWQRRYRVRPASPPSPGHCCFPPA